MQLLHNMEHRGYTPLYFELLDPSLKTQGDLKETFYIGPLEIDATKDDPNRWPSEEALPSWRATMEVYHNNVLFVGKKLLSLVALALNLDEDFFEKIGALHRPMAFIRLLHYPGDILLSESETLGATPHSDYGMLTILATDGVPGLQICQEKDKHPQIWQDVHHIDGAFVVNIGDMLERWTNCLFRSTLHRVRVVGQERYSVAFFLDPNSDCIVKCLDSCCSESSPPRFPPIRSGDYLKERLRATYSSYKAEDDKIRKQE